METCADESREAYSISGRARERCRHRRRRASLSTGVSSKNDSPVDALSVLLASKRSSPERSPEVASKREGREMVATKTARCGGLSSLTAKSTYGGTCARARDFAPRLTRREQLIRRRRVARCDAKGANRCKSSGEIPYDAPRRVITPSLPPPPLPSSSFCLIPTLSRYRRRICLSKLPLKARSRRSERAICRPDDDDDDDARHRDRSDMHANSRTSPCPPLSLTPSGPTPARVVRGGLKGRSNSAVTPPRRAVTWRGRTIRGGGGGKTIHGGVSVVGNFPLESPRQSLWRS